MKYSPNAYNYTEISLLLCSDGGSCPGHEEKDHYGEILWALRRPLCSKQFINAGQG